MASLMKSDRYQVVEMLITQDYESKVAVAENKTFDEAINIVKNLYDKEDHTTSGRVLISDKVLGSSFIEAYAIESVLDSYFVVYLTDGNERTRLNKFIEEWREVCKQDK